MTLSNSELLVRVNDITSPHLPSHRMTVSKCVQSW